MSYQTQIEEIEVLDHLEQNKRELIKDLKIMKGQKDEKRKNEEGFTIAYTEHIDL